MFRNPRENASKLPTDYVAPSVGRPPSPPGTASFPATHISTRRPSTNMATLASSPLPSIGRASTTPKAAALSSAKKPKGKPNGSILTFFKKAENVQEDLFVRPAIGSKAHRQLRKSARLDVPSDMQPTVPAEADDFRFNETVGPSKRQKVDGPRDEVACSESRSDRRASAGPFTVDSDDEDDSQDNIVIDEQHGAVESTSSFTRPEVNGQAIPARPEPGTTEDQKSKRRLHLPEEETSFSLEHNSIDAEQDIEPDVDADELDGFEDDIYEEGEEFVERRWMEEQARLEAEDTSFDQDAMPRAVNGPSSAIPACPICAQSLAKLSEQQAAIHVNNCLDGNPTPLPVEIKQEDEAVPEPPTTSSAEVANRFRRQPRAAKPGQADPFAAAETSNGGSAFSKLMSNKAEDAAWAEAAAAEHAARGKPAYQRTCPFYKILPGFNICVDAFRYGAVKGCQAYFLSHFHSDHYIGLTSTWCHGPIYCSKVTGNLVKQQLRVDPKYVVSLDWEQKTEVPGSNGVSVTMISANHCPGSSLFLYEKVIGKGANPKMQRVLHCGDFRACQAHVEHPLLRPDVIDAVKGRSKQQQQKLDVCYLDTTYLNPRYAFPSQENVIKACADMCVSLNKHTVDEDDGWEQMKRERAGAGMIQFVRKESDTFIKQEPDDKVDKKTPTTKQRGRLLVIVGTYSIGKERICLGIARALKSKIYAPPGKQRICRALEDAEIDALLTSDPREAQVHMTPLFEIRAETLEDYLKDYREHFSRAVGFRPSGWNYRPPNSRFTESPSVQTILHSGNWKSSFSMKDLVPQRGSSSRASCFGVPYSEHSSFRELTMFCCALNIDKIIPTVNIGNAKSRERMKAWCVRWAKDRQKNGLFKLKPGESWS